MKIINIERVNGKGQKLILSSGEYSELVEALRQAGKYTIYQSTSNGECGRFEVEVEH